QPPGPMLVDLAKALRVSVDQLLGVKAFKESVSPRTARLLNRLRRIEELPPADQRAVLRYLDALLARSGSERTQRRAASRRSGTSPPSAATGSVRRFIALQKYPSSSIKRSRRMPLSLGSSSSLRPVSESSALTARRRACFSSSANVRLPILTRS